MLAVALFAGLTLQASRAQAPAPGLQPNVDLTASLDHGPEPFTPVYSVGASQLKPPSAANTKLFDDVRPEEGGWKGLARVLDALTPSVDTSIPLTASQITDRISAMLDRGQNQQALQVIEKRSAQVRQQGALGTDVQLLFLRGRALSALGRHEEAIKVYRDMTTLFPELPEPWNNLAAEYVRQGRLEMARDALGMALTADPHYAVALGNLGEVQLMLARQSFQQAGAGARAQQTTELLKH